MYRWTYFIDMDILSSVVWIKSGAAKATPIKFAPDEEELNSLIAKNGIQDDDEDDDKSKDGDMDVEKQDDKIDQDDDDDNILIPGVGPIAMHASNTDDPLLEIKDDGEDSDAEDFYIRSDDNLIVAAHIEDDTSSLEVYVYNDKEGYLYVHHDILMLHMPLCLTWLDYDVKNTNPVNYVAVGSMEGVIELFDVDLVDQMEPIYTFGKKSRKKKTKSSKKSSKKSGEGHDAAVLDLSWNKLVRQILASSSADATVALWDLSQMKMALHLNKIHEKQIQSICWHPTEPQNLLSGSADQTVCLVDCRDANNKNNQHRWTFDSDIERVAWNTFDSNQFLASTENGYVYAMDIRQTTIPVFSLAAHSGAVTGLCLSSTVPGFLMTSSFDETVKIWDVENGSVTFIAERQFPTGRINTCLANPDFPFTFAIGGQSKGLQIWDCTENSNVRSRFGSRAKFEMVEVSSAETEATEPKVSSFPTTTPNVTSAVLKAQRKKLSKKNK
ncbi:unnamed protein product [Adineta ricciae]|uniref:Periodic tryptophan protein 1-like protein n=1 Tax=Adineta ricciae TaxID=249248 RepID=A0A813T646_ADIRI|nr:unnamed protein product [Adineta ricciae]